MIVLLKYQNIYQYNPKHKRLKFHEHISKISGFNQYGLPTAYYNQSNGYKMLYLRHIFVLKYLAFYIYIMFNVYSYFFDGEFCKP